MGLVPLQLLAPFYASLLPSVTEKKDIRRDLENHRREQCGLKLSLWDAPQYCLIASPLLNLFFMGYRQKKKERSVKEESLALRRGEVKREVH